LRIVGDAEELGPGVELELELRVVCRHREHLRLGRNRREGHRHAMHRHEARTRVRPHTTDMTGKRRIGQDDSVWKVPAKSGAI
jgi:hypothetical protein